MCDRIKSFGDNIKIYTFKMRVLLSTFPFVRILALNPPLFSNAFSNASPSFDLPIKAGGRLQGSHNSTPSIRTFPTLNLSPTRAFN